MMKVYSRRATLMGWKPYDAEIEYLGSDSNAYINTGISGNNYYLRITGHFMYTTHVNYGAIYGNYVSDNHSGTRLVLSNKSNKIISNLNTICATEGNTTVDCTKNVKHSFFANWGNVKIDSTTTTVQNKDAGDTNNGNICIFNRSMINVVSRNIGLKIYDFQIYDHGTLVRDYIPVRVGTAGYLYDRVSGELFGNAGTGSFILGPDVAPAAYANEIAFLESTGSQYIDTGIIPTDKHGFRVSCYVPQKAGGGSYNDRVIGIHGTSRWLLSIHDNSNATFFGWNDAYSNLGEYYNTNVVADLNYLNDRTAKINNETKISTLPTLGSISESAFLFGNRNTDALFIGRIYSCKITYEDTLVRDFIPVEYNNIGYMYDKVSGEFFANQGTGKFVLGHRAPRFDGKACARSYTRRQ